MPRRMLPSTVTCLHDFHHHVRGSPGRVGGPAVLRPYVHKRGTSEGPGRKVPPSCTLPTLQGFVTMAASEKDTIRAHWRCFLACGIAVLAPFQYGIDFGMIGGLQAMPGFLKVRRLVSIDPLPGRALTPRAGLRLLFARDRLEYRDDAPAVDLVAHDPGRIHQLRDGRLHGGQAGAKDVSVAGVDALLCVHRHHDDHDEHRGPVHRSFSYRACQRVLHDLLPAVHTGNHPEQVPRSLPDGLPILHIDCKSTKPVSPSSRRAFSPRSPRAP